MAKATKAQTEQRVHDVFTMLVNGVNRFDIVRHAAKHWKLKSRQVDTLLARAHILIAEEASYHRPREIGKAKARMDQVFRQAVSEHKWNDAINAQREISKLFSLYEPEAPRVLSIAGVDEAQLKTLAEAIRKIGMKPSDIFESMLQELAEANRE